MKNMTLISMVLILFGGIIMLSGCYSIPIIDQPRVTPSSSTEYISVESTPSDAEIYINNMLVGRTPSKGLPITVHYTALLSPAIHSGVVKFFFGRGF